MTPRQRNAITRDEHEVIPEYDWMLNPEENDDFSKWAQELEEC